MQRLRFYRCLAGGLGGPLLLLNAARRRAVFSSMPSLETVGGDESGVRHAARVLVRAKCSFLAAAVGARLAAAAASLLHRD